MGGGADFPVLHRDEKIISGRLASAAIGKMPTVAVDLVFVEPSIKEEAVRFLEQQHDQILEAAQPTEED